MKKIYLLAFALIGAISNVFTAQAQAENVDLPLSWYAEITAQASFVQAQNASPYNQIVTGNDEQKKAAVKAFFADNTWIGDRRLVWGTGQQTSGYGLDLENITSTGFDYKGRSGISGEFVAQIYDMEHAASSVTVSFNAGGTVNNTTFSIWKISGGVATKLASTSANFSTENTITAPDANIQKQDRLVLMWTSMSSGGAVVKITNFSASYTHVPETYNLPIGPSKWATIYLDFKATIPENVKVYGVKVSGDGKKALLEEVTGVIDAKKGYLVNGNETSYSFAETEVNAVASTVETDMLGSVTDTYVPGAAYVLANGTSGVGFYKTKLNKDENGGSGESHFKNNAHKAYLPIPAGSSEARVLTFDFDGNAETGINAVEIEEAAPVNAAIYDLSGRRVQSAKSGLYIINGKKVIK